MILSSRPYLSKSGLLTSWLTNPKVKKILQLKQKQLCHIKEKYFKWLTFRSHVRTESLYGTKLSPLPLPLPTAWSANLEITKPRVVSDLRMCRWKSKDLLRCIKLEYIFHMVVCLSNLNTPSGCTFRNEKSCNVKEWKWQKHM